MAQTLLVDDNALNADVQTRRLVHRGRRLPIDDLLQRVRAEYRETPGLSLTLVLAPFAVDQVAVRCSSGHKNVGSWAVPVSLSWPITGMRTTATRMRRERPRAVKMWLQVSRVLTTPACIAGVLVSRPNFNALCGRCPTQC